jgi:hypothetical protein
MVRLARFCFIFACIAWAGLLTVSSSVTAQGAVTVRLEPSSVKVALDETVDVAVEVVDVQNLYAIDITLNYDPHVVTIIDADPDLDGVQVALGTFLDPGFVLLNNADNGEGRLRFAMTQLNPSTPKNGTGFLIVIKLRGVELSGQSPLELVAVQMATNTGVEIPVNLKNGRVEVLQSIVGPTNTPMPTQGPGTPLPTRTPIPPTDTPQPTEPLPTSTATNTATCLTFTEK